MAFCTIASYLNFGVSIQLIYPLIFGDLLVAFEECDHIISGTIRSGSQHHIYLEAQVFDNEAQLYNKCVIPACCICCGWLRDILNNT